MNKVKIIQLALAKIGIYAGDTAESDKNVAMGIDMTDLVIRQLMSVKYNWSFCKKDKSLQLTNEKPFNPLYQFVYALPNDWYSTIKIYTQGAIEFYNHRYITNLNPFEIQYLAVPKFEEIPDFLYEALIYLYANALVVPATEKIKYTNAFSLEIEKALKRAVEADKAAIKELTTWGNPPPNERGIRLGLHTEQF